MTAPLNFVREPSNLCLLGLGASIFVAPSSSLRTSSLSNCSSRARFFSSFLARFFSSFFSVNRAFFSSFFLEFFERGSGGVGKASMAVMGRSATSDEDVCWGVQLVDLTGWDLAHRFDLNLYPQRYPRRYYQFAMMNWLHLRPPPFPKVRLWRLLSNWYLYLPRWGQRCNTFYINDPSVAQLEERGTVMDIQSSQGHWFEPGLRDFNFFFVRFTVN